MKRGAMSKYFAVITRVSATEVRELVSSASVRDALDGHLREDRHGGDRAVRDHCAIRHHRVAFATQVLDRRNQAEVDLAAVQQAGARAGQVVAHREAVATRFEPDDERTSVEIGDRADANDRHQPRRVKSAPRSTGSPDAARMLRRISSSGERRRPSVTSSLGDTPSTSSAPKVNATCASLGPYRCQSTWMWCDRHQQARQRHQVHVVVPGRRREAAGLARQRREHVDGGIRLDERRDPREQRRTIGLGGTVHREPRDRQAAVAAASSDASGDRSPSTGASATADKPGLLQRRQPRDSGGAVTCHPLDVRQRKRRHRHGAGSGNDGRHGGDGLIEIAQECP